MRIAKGYRIRTVTVAEFGLFLRRFRQESLRAFSRTYAQCLARETARRIDLHHAGVRMRPEDGNPLEESLEHLRDRYRAARTGRRTAGGALDLECEMYVHPHTDGFVYCAMMSGAALYGDILLRQPGAEAYSWWDDAAPPRGVAPETWEERGGRWRAVLEKLPLHRGLGFTLVGQKLPAIPVAAVGKHMPPFADRVTAAASTRLMSELSPGHDPHDAEAPIGFEEWLRSKSGAARLASARQDVMDLLSYNPDSAELQAYGRSRHVTRASAVRGSGVMIDHADVIETRDGRIYLAVPPAGLARDERVFLQVGDGYVAIVQRGIQFGHVDNIPRFLLDVLASRRETVVVEVEGTAEDGRIVGRHAATVNDLRLADSYHNTIGRWRRDASSGANGREEKEWA